jgi:hypothetical protein
MTPHPPPNPFAFVPEIPWEEKPTDANSVRAKYVLTPIKGAAAKIREDLRYLRELDTKFGQTDRLREEAKAELYLILSQITKGKK